MQLRLRMVVHVSITFMFGEDMKEKSFFRLIQQDLMRFSASNNLNGLLYLKLFHPRFLPVALIRISRALYSCRFLRPLAFIVVWGNFIVFGIEVTPRCEIGGGLFLPHSSGTVIGAARVGENVTIFQGVTIGTKYADLKYEESNRPIIEDSVVLGAGSKVLGNITVGAGALVAANSLVINSVPPGVTVIGVPALVRA